MLFHTRQRFQGRVSQKVKLFTFWYTLYSNRGPVPGPRPAPPKGINRAAALVASEALVDRVLSTEY